MVQALRNSGRRIAFAALCCGVFALGASAQDDPPSRVARLNYMQGNVSMEPAGADDWAPAVVNRPFTVGDYLYTDQGSQAELHMDVAVMRMAPQTSFGFLNLDDQTVQIKLSEGEMYIRVHNFSPNQVFEVDTPNSAVTLLREGTYHFNVDPNGNASFVVVRSGQAEVTGGGQAFTLNPGNSADLSGTDRLSYDIETAPQPDQFDNWSAQRDNHEAHLVSARYLPPTVIGYEDLDDYGGWQQAPTYGAVWYPRQVAVGWAPYHSGHWAWVEPWGYTWVDDAPWGFAPFHYGRWSYISGRWGWCPGPMAVGVSVGYRGPVVRPYYAPALVAFFGGAHFSVGISLGFGGGGASMGWVPLGFGEVYSPPYRVSSNYFRQVNVANTTINRTVNITNVYNTTYVNKTTTVTNITYVNMRAPNAVMAMPQSAFASGRSAAREGRPVPAAEVARIQPAQARIVAPTVAPTRQALIPSAGNRPAAHPPQQVMARQVVAKAAPPPPRASFAARQSYLQQHAGQLHDSQAMHQAVAARQPAVAAAVRRAPAAKTVQVRPGQKVGNPTAFRAAAATGHPASTVQPAARPTAATPAARTPAAHATPQPATAAPTPAERAAPKSATHPEAHPAERVAPQPATHPAAHPAEPPATQPVERPAAPPAERAAPKPAIHPEARPAAPAKSEVKPAPRTEVKPAPKVAPRTEAKPAARTEPKPAHGTPPAHHPTPKTTKDTKEPK